MRSCHACSQCPSVIDVLKDLLGANTAEMSIFHLDLFLEFESAYEARFAQKKLISALKALVPLGNIGAVHFAEILALEHPASLEAAISESSKRLENCPKPAATALIGTRKQVSKVVNGWAATGDVPRKVGDR